MRSRRRFVPLPLLAALMLGLPTLAAPPSGRTTTTAWYGVFLDGKHAGYLASTQERGVRWRGRRPAVLSTNRMRADLAVTGVPTTTSMDERAWSDTAGEPLEEDLTQRSGGRTTRVHALYTGRSLAYTADIDGEPRRGTLRLGPGERFLRVDLLAPAKTPPALRGVRYKQFNPVTLTLEDAEVSVGTRKRSGRREVIEVGGQGVAAYRTTLSITGTPASVWVDKDDAVLRFDVGPARFVRMSRERASARPGSPVEVTDLSVVTTDRPIPNPRSLRRARYRVEKLSAPLAAADDDVQTAAQTKTADGLIAAVVTVATGPASDALPTPIASIPRDRFAAHLAPSLYAPSDDPVIRAMARRIVAGETDAGRAADTLCAWVHGALRYDAGRASGLPRRATEVLKDRRGVCQDYATLLVTLARAAGVPAKHCVGLACGDDGRFYPHAWAEVWVGRWVALEPTWGAPFADATHIKLAEGEPSADRAGLSRLDPLRVTVLEPGDQK